MPNGLTFASPEERQTAIEALQAQIANIEANGIAPSDGDVALLPSVAAKAEQADLDALDNRVGINEGAIVTFNTALNDMSAAAYEISLETNRPLDSEGTFAGQEFQAQDRSVWQFDGTTFGVTPKLPALTAGPAGTVGPTGPPGATGATGPAGADGATGPQGIQGPIGPDGPTGAAGPTGPAGTDGTNGVDGVDGTTGLPLVIYVDDQIGLDDTLKLTAAINAANTAGSNGFPTSIGSRIEFDARKYVIPDADLLPSVAADEVWFGGQGEGATGIETDLGELFRFGDGGATLVDGGGVENMAIKYPTGNTDSTGTVVHCNNAARQVVRNIRLYEAPALLKMTAAAGKTVGGIHVHSISGITADNGVPVCHASGLGNKSGLFIHDINVGCANINIPAETGTTPHDTAVGTDFLRIDDNFDTVVGLNVTTLRYHRSIYLNNPTAGQSQGNLWFTNWIGDYAHTAFQAVVNGGNLFNVTFRGGWLYSSDGPTVDLDHTTGLLQGIKFVETKWMMAGIHNINIPVGADDVTLDDIDIYGTGRITPSVGISQTAGADRVDVGRVRYHDASFLYTAGGDHPPTTAFEMLGPNNQWSLVDCMARATTTHYSIAGGATTGPRKRTLRGNRCLDGTKPEYLVTESIAAPATGVVYTNYSPWAMHIYSYSGTVTQVDLNGTAAPWVVASGAAHQIVLQPGDTVQLTHGSAPVWRVNRVEA